MRDGSPPASACSLLALNVGRIRPLGVRALPSGIAKQPVGGPVLVTRTGLTGDEHGDLQHHGGPDKALHHYPAEHYVHWQVELPGKAHLFEIGGFGENLSTRGMTEDTVCLGDVYALGGAVLQVSQGRQPCARLNLRFGIDDMVERVRRSARTGWYYRVLDEGMAGPRDALALIERPHPEWPLARVWRVLFAHAAEPRLLAELAGMPVLGASALQGWREPRGRRPTPASSTWAPARPAWWMSCWVADIGMSPCRIPPVQRPPMRNTGWANGRRGSSGWRATSAA